MVGRVQAMMEELRLAVDRWERSQPTLAAVRSHSLLRYDHNQQRLQHPLSHSLSHRVPRSKRRGPQGGDPRCADLILKDMEDDNLRELMSTFLGCGAVLQGGHPCAVALLKREYVAHRWDQGHTFA